MHKTEIPKGKMNQIRAFTYNFLQILHIGKKSTETYTKAFLLARLPLSTK